ncbi:hypothetical protein ILUMI_15079, partial [Ignelater luminosus]
MVDKEIKILCYADDAVVIAENERLLHQFKIIEQAMELKYLGIDISRYDDIDEE